MGDFEASDFVSAVAIALIAEMAFVGMMYPPDRPLHTAEIDDSNSKPIAVAITPVPLLKQGGPSTLPPAWQRKAAPPQPKPQPRDKQPDAPLPSPQAQQTPAAIPKDHVPDAAAPQQQVPEAAAPTTNDPLAASDAAAPSTAVDPNAQPSDAGANTPSGPGDPNGSPNGTETDPLKARALDRYKASIAAWLKSNFNIRGKIAFEKLKTLHASAVVSASADRTVTGFNVTAPSGDPIFDAEVRSALQSKVGATLPAPPPNYPEFAQQTISVGFACNVQSQCE